MFKKKTKIKVEVVVTPDQNLENTINIALEAIKKIEKDRKVTCGQLNITIKSDF